MTHGRTHRRLRHDRRLPDRRARLPRRLDRLVLCTAFDSEACFAALLGSPEHGRWSIAPRTKAKITRRYRTDTLVLETQFETADGAATLIDFMPTGLHRSSIVRLVVGTRGSMAMSTELILRFGYGAVVPWVTRLEDGVIRAIAGPDMVVVRTPVHLRGKGMTTVGEFNINKDDTIPFVLSYLPSHRSLNAPFDPTRALQRHGNVLARLGGEVPPRRAMVGCRAPIDDHAQSADLHAYRRNGRRADDLAARAFGRRAQLGLSVLLAARCHPGSAGCDECRLLRGSAGMARVVVACGRRKSGAVADHVRHRRRAAADRMDGAVVARLREFRAGADRQCRV